MVSAGNLPSAEDGHSRIGRSTGLCTQAVSNSDRFPAKRGAVFADHCTGTARIFRSQAVRAGCIFSKILPRFKKIGFDLMFPVSVSMKGGEIVTSDSRRISRESSQYVECDIPAATAGVQTASGKFSLYAGIRS